MKKALLTITVISLVCSLLQAQLILTQESYSGNIPMGPALESSTLRFMQLTNTGSYRSPDMLTSVSFHLTNMQMKADGVVEVLSFGTSYRETMKWPEPVPVYQPMKSIGKSLSKWFNGSDAEEGIINAGTQHGVFAFASIKHLSNSHIPKAGEKIYYGDLIVSFNRPVSNPLLHFAGLGGLVEKDGVTRGFSVEMELVTPAITLEKTAGTDNFTVLPDYIGNSKNLLSPYCGTGAACGTTKVHAQNLETLQFRVYLKRDSRESGYRKKWPLMRNIHWGDGWVMSVSFEQDLNCSGEILLADLNPVKNQIEAQPLYVNLIDPLKNITLAFQPVAADRSFSISGLTGNQSYELQLSTIPGIAGMAASPAKLPETWKHDTGGIFAEKFNSSSQSYLINVGDQDITNIQFTLRSEKSDSKNMISINESSMNSEIISEKPESNTLIEAADEPKIATVSEINTPDIQISSSTEIPSAMEARPLLVSRQEDLIKLLEENCYVIVGSFLMEHNVRRMEQRLIDGNYDTYVLPGPPKGSNNFTRVGYKINCEEKDKNLASARNTFDPESWFLQYEWSPSYGMHYQAKSLWYLNIITSGMDVDPDELKIILSSKR